MDTISRDEENGSGRSCEVLVIGGGPAGTTVSSILKNKGHDVVLIDKDKHPRFHIGESLLPMNLPILERLGVLDEIRDIGLRKNGAEFISESSPDGTVGQKRSHTFYFKNAMNKSAPGYAYQVRRSEFDQILLDNCQSSGVNVQRQHKVTAVNFAETHANVTVKDTAGKSEVWTADFVIDASGRDSFLARSLKIKEKNQSHNSAAIFGHFKGVERRSGSDAGNISIYWFKYGWFWLIPLADGTMSVGAVCQPDYLKSRKSNLETFFHNTLALCPGAQHRMQGSRLVGEINATGNYTYAATRSYGNRYLLVGDSFAFVDPVFSSGVFLCMSAAEIAADAVSQSLLHPDRGDQLFRAYEKQVRKGVKVVSWFIYRFNTPVMRKLFMDPKNIFGIEEAVISMLAGDIYGESPIKLRIALFKMIYYTSSLKNLPASFKSFLRRRKSTQSNFVSGTLDVDKL